MAMTVIAMTEQEHAVVLANRVLERVNADPDDDLAVLARQFLRAHDEVARLRETLAYYAGLNVGDWDAKASAALEKDTRG